MKKIVLKYLIIIIAGTIGLLLPLRLLRMQKERTLSMTYTNDAGASDIIILSQPAETPDAQKSTDDISYEAKSRINNIIQRVNIYNNRNTSDRPVYELNMFEHEGTVQLMDKLKKVTEDIDRIIGSDISLCFSTSSDSASQRQIIAYSYSGIYINKTLEFYRVELMYDSKDSPRMVFKTTYNFTVTFDASTLKIYELYGDCETDFSPDEMINAYSEYMELPDYLYENYYHEDSLSNASRQNGSFIINASKKDTYVSLRLAFTGNYEPEPVPTQQVVG